MSDQQPRGTAGGEGGSAAAGGFAVLLVGHGSHLSPGSSRPIRALARELGARGACEEIRVAFWKEDPHLHHALEIVEHPDVVVVPVFTSTGYFTDEVVPRELGVAAPEAGADPDVPVPGPDPAARGAGRDLPARVRLCDPVGTHPRMADLILARALEAEAGRGPVAPDAGDEAALVVVGHGTPRHPDSGRTTRALVDALRTRWTRGPVASAFLDEAPRVDEVVRAAEAARVVVVPFFISEGWHAGVTLPGGLGVESGRSRIEGKEILYARAVGTHPGLADVVEEMVRAVRGPAMGTTRNRNPARAARAAFQAWIREGGPAGRRFLQTWIRPDPEGGFEVRHRDDEPLSQRELTTHTDPDEAGEIAALTADGRHRPLKTAPDLRGGWRFSGLSPGDVAEVLAHLYPAAVVHWHAARAGEARPVSFREAALRQTGMFAGLRDLDDAAVEAAIEGCCVGGGCLRRIRWGVAPGREPGGAAEPGEGTAEPEEAMVPCLAPCSLLLSHALSPG